MEEKVEEKVETADEKVIDAEPVAEPARRRTCRRGTRRRGTRRPPNLPPPNLPSPNLRVPRLDLACLVPRRPRPSFSPRRRRFRGRDGGPRAPRGCGGGGIGGAAVRSAAAAKTVAVASDPSKDAYDVLGAAPGDAPAAIKRAFWKLSLMVHPDKCDHPEAARAFDLAKRAHATLADAAKRAAIDDAREARDAREGFDEWLAEERKKAEWRALQGTPAEGDEAILRGGNGGDGGDGASAAESREEWMTRLPEQRKPTPGGAPSRGNARSFATTEFVERDARTVAEWTDAPKDAATREARLLAAARERALALPGRRRRRRRRRRRGNWWTRSTRNEGPRRSSSNTANAPNAPRGRRRKRTEGPSLSANAAGKRGTGATGRGGSTALGIGRRIWKRGGSPPRRSTRRRS